MQGIDQTINQYFIENCIETMQNRIPDNSVDLVISSPPYDDIRKYNGNYSFDFENVAKQLYRIMAPGGVVVWVVGDSVVKGTETGTSFKQALYFMSLGFNLHDTMLYEKNTSSFPAKRNGNRYTQIFEYMFIFSKGNPKTVNLLCDKENKWSGWTNWGKKSHRDKNDELVQTKDIKPVPDFSPRNNIWKYNVGKNYITKDKFAHKHPAIFPELLAEDHILSWSKENDIIYDPFCGSGTVLKMAKLNNRRFIGSDLTSEYEDIIKQRIVSTLRVPRPLVEKKNINKYVQKPKKGNLNPESSN